MQLTCPQCETIHSRSDDFTCDCGWPFVFSKNSSGPLPAENPEILREQGRRSWGLLHSMPFVEEEWIPERQSEKYEQEWKPTIPSYGCSCSSEFTKIVEIKQPVFTSRIEFYEWGVWAHNEVNRRIKPLQPLWKPTDEILRLTELKIRFDEKKILELQ